MDNPEEMDVDHPEKMEIQHKCEWCNVDVRNYSSSSSSCIFCEQSCCSSSCSSLAITARNRGMKKLAIKFKEFDHICKRCVEQKIGIPQ